MVSQEKLHLALADCLECESLLNSCKITRNSHLTARYSSLFIHCLIEIIIEIFNNPGNDGDGSVCPLSVKRVGNDGDGSVCPLSVKRVGNDGDGSVCPLSVKRVGLYCEKTVPVSASSTNCFVFVCSKKF